MQHVRALEDLHFRHSTSTAGAEAWGCAVVVGEGGGAPAGAVGVDGGVGEERAGGGEKSSGGVMRGLSGQ